MRQLFAIYLLEKEIEHLKNEETESSKILLSQYQRELIVLKRLSMGNLEATGKSLKEFEAYMEDKVVFLESKEKIQKIDKFSEMYEWILKFFMECENIGV